jgi:hypothetical protein
MWTPRAWKRRRDPPSSTLSSPPTRPPAAHVSMMSALGARAFPWFQAGRGLALPELHAEDSFVALTLMADRL